jgi:6-phosphofructokinase 1
MTQRIGILVGGGPAPGINSVISAATIRCVLDGAEVFGIYDGFRWIMEGDTGHIEPLTIDKVSRIHFRGGSYLRTSRANPTRDAAHLENCVQALLGLGITGLVTIGGDDTAFSAMKVEEKAAGRLRVVHVPKTIDNDLVLQPGTDTFGFQTARHVGAQVVKTLMVDAATTSRWYFAIAMGRKAGHLALGIGKAAGATLTLIPEEFGDGKIRLARIVDTLTGAIVKRLADGHPNGVAVIAEGVVLGLDPADLEDLEDVERDEHGHVRLAEVNIGEMLKTRVKARLAELGIKMTIVDKNIGYELRCADPIPSDMEYTRDLGYCAAKVLLQGGGGIMVTMQHTAFVPMKFGDLLDPATGRTRVRMVDVNSAGYAIARRYMIRLRGEDFAHEGQLGRLAAACKLDPDGFRERFHHVVEDEPHEPELG